MKEMGESGIYVEPREGFAFSPADLLREVAWSGVTTSLRGGHYERSNAGEAYIMTTSARISHEWPRTRAIREIIVPHVEAAMSLTATGNAVALKSIPMMVQVCESTDRGGKAVQFLLRITIADFFEPGHAVLVWDDGAAVMVPVDWSAGA